MKYTKGMLDFRGRPSMTDDDERQTAVRWSPPYQSWDEIDRRIDVFFAAKKAKLTYEEGWAYIHKYVEDRHPSEIDIPALQRARTKILNVLNGVPNE